LAVLPLRAGTFAGREDLVVETVETGQLERQVTDAIGVLQAHIQKVEIWAGAVVGFAQPVPDGEMRARGAEVLGR
jgi:hypothetical protein